MKLYEISQTMQDFLNAVEAGLIPDEAIPDTLEGLELALDQKLEDCACAYKALLYDAASIKAEADALTARRKQKEASAERLAAYIDRCLRSTVAEGVKPPKRETPRAVFSYRASKAVAITDEAAALAACKASDALSACYKIPAPTLDKPALKKAIEGGQTIPGVEIVENLNLQIK